MNLEIENPFADYGNIVTGDRFIGRKDSLRVIANRVTRPQEPGNLAIIGDPRIGKSSLVYKAVIESKSVLISKRLLPIWINLATYDQPPIFFKSLITRCIDELEDLNWITEAIQRAANHALQDEVSWSEGYTRIQRFFEKIRQSNIRILFILDEFDHARFLFKGDISGFQGLRELSYRPEWRVTFITTSRRTIREIELQSQAISTLDGIFHKHYLSIFNDEDFQAFTDRLNSVGLSFTSEIIDEIEFYCGKHPYLLAMLGYEVVEVFCEQQRVDVNVAFQKIERSFVNHYDSIFYLLQEDGNLGKLLQILFGPVIDVKQTDVDEFLRYGFIRLNKQGTYTAFSEHFHSFLSLIERETDLWNVWRDTEKNLRIVLTSTLQDKYGSDWFSQLEKSHPNLCMDKQSGKNLFQKCR
jgi:AAA+ ATPase superfamily predicted ATPase